MDLELLQLIRKKGNLTVFLPHMRPELLQPYTRGIARGLEQYFEAHPEEEEVEWSSFRTWYGVTHATSMTVADAKLVTHTFDKLEREMGVEPVLKDILDTLMRQAYAKRAGDIVEDVAAGRKEMADFHDIVDEYDKACDRVFTPEKVFASFDVGAIDDAVHKKGFSWPLKSLQDSLGTLRGGDFIIVAARPEVGKTTFAAQITSNWAKQLRSSDGKTILWVNNEERSNKVTFRIRQSYSGATQAWLLDPANRDDPAFLESLDICSKYIFVTKNEAGLNDRRSIEAYLRDHPPAAVVFDQLDKVQGFESAEDKDVERIGQAYLWARNLGHQYDCPIMAISQCSAEAEGMDYIPQSLLRGSKTDKPGEADVIITIGKKPDGEDRFINICKNKLHGPLVELYRHGKHVVKLRADIARYEDTK